MFAQQAGLFRTAIATADQAADVPSCPGWTFEDLTVHVARFLHTATRYLTSGSIVELKPLPVRRDVDPVVYLDEQLAAATQVLNNTSGNRPVWTFSPSAPDLAWVWHRRVAHELNLRRWDAQAALRTLTPTDREQAADAIDELLGTLLAARLRGDSPPRFRGTAVVSCTDGPQAWFVRLAPGEVPEVRSADRNEKADARLSNRTANVLYQLRGRMQLTGEGDPTVLKALRMS
ncbi:MAG: maleylpyruvate isomerase N-terminal domain-containing protein [Actinomycetota bacterium]|nr:maleylpyruvate isomerase N-terminal domain-containing protein [Actinomycetota bacterium]